mmetsp:Transcript_23568/g.59788  ORF Transcript_23568/g.59788 Transcript_23568/m.59788 type:complete len:206 (+) Transcript_23568:138-755(+)
MGTGLEPPVTPAVSSSLPSGPDPPSYSEPGSPLPLSGSEPASPPESPVRPETFPWAEAVDVVSALTQRSSSSGSGTRGRFFGREPRKASSWATSRMSTSSLTSAERCCSFVSLNRFSSSSNKIPISYAHSAPAFAGGGVATNCCACLAMMCICSCVSSFVCKVCRTAMRCWYCCCASKSCFCCCVSCSSCFCCCVGCCDCGRCCC